LDESYLTGEKIYPVYLNRFIFIFRGNIFYETHCNTILATQFEWEGHLNAAGNFAHLLYTLEMHLKSCIIHFTSSKSDIEYLRSKNHFIHGIYVSLLSISLVPDADSNTYIFQTVQQIKRPKLTSLMLLNWSTFHTHGKGHPIPALHRVPIQSIYTEELISDSAPRHPYVNPEIFYLSI